MGESPLWHPRSSTLLWTDLYGPTVSASTVAGGPVSTWAVPSMPGGLALLAGSTGVLVAVETGLVHLDLPTGLVHPLLAAPHDASAYRINDVRCDPAGRLWVGTSRKPQSGRPRGSAAYYRLDGGNLVPAVDGVTIANGLAFSPDGATMYLSDTAEHCLWAFDYDLSTGIPSGRRLFAQLEQGALPDGATVDAEGAYWVALYGAGRVVRFTPDGTCDRVVDAPVSHPTMVAFGGSDRSVLFLTTARAFVDDATLAREPLAGGVFYTDAGVRGLEEPELTLPAVRAAG